jgi:hypothetical protein
LDRQPGVEGKPQFPIRSGGYGIERRAIAANWRAGVACLAARLVLDFLAWDSPNAAIVHCLARLLLGDFAIKAFGVDS